MQSAFRIALHAHQQPHTSRKEAEHARQPRSRRPHNKSRVGCINCKRSRRKCDEEKSRCSLCVKRGLTCTYAEKQSNWSRSINREATQTALMIRHKRGLWPGAHAPMVLTMCSKTSHTEHDLFLLHHFVQHTAQYFETAEHRVYSDKALALAKQQSFLMHAMIALAACHLQHLGIDAKQYRLAEAFHCHLASRGLRASISSITDTEVADSVLTTSMLLNTLTFCADDYRKASTKPQWGWLRIQIGLTEMLRLTSPFRPDSIWSFLFKASDNYEVLTPGHNDMGERLAKFCGIDEPSDSDENPYVDMVKRLDPIVSRDVSPDYLPLYLRAVGAISSQVIDLLEAQDTRALLLFAHWLRLMCSIDQWWCVRRTRRECRMICEILSQQLDATNMGLLELPAKACGYLQELQLPALTPEVKPINNCNQFNADNA